MIGKYSGSSIVFGIQLCTYQDKYYSKGSRMSVYMTNERHNDSLNKMFIDGHNINMYKIIWYKIN